MAIWGKTLLSLLSLPLLWLFLWAIKVYIEWHKIKKMADVIKEHSLDDIITAIESIGETTSTASLLIPIAQKSRELKYMITLPDHLEAPWSGKTIQFTPSGNLNVSMVDQQGLQIGNTVFQEIRIPRITLRSGRQQNMWSTARYIKNSDTLRNLLSPINPQKQSDALGHIFGASIEVGGGLHWIQNAEYPKCDQCRGKMKFLIQTEGILFPKSVDFNIHESTIYIFGCAKKHDPYIQKVIQFS
ncbi:MAG: hypothetical protein COA43_07630 [Robiginitomaculum sp.]|nr:MAG: hypothetical protein COA43_07630 [Robiginitomaculum sp.]